MSDAAPSFDWERFREFLSLLARLRLDRRLQGKIDVSGIVQQTLLDAYQSLPNVDGWSDAQKAAWLRQTLANNMTDEIRKMKAARRDVGREQSLHVQLADSVSRLELLLPARQSTPSQHASREERMLQVVQALNTLPEGQRQVIELHHLQGRSLAETAEDLGTTKAAVAGLLHRGLKALRQALQDESNE
jgi:RNA polymerase sigma-70 factor, ECF subfamily